MNEKEIVSVKLIDEDALPDSDDETEGKKREFTSNFFAFQRIHTVFWLRLSMQTTLLKNLPTRNKSWRKSPDLRLSTSACSAGVRGRDPEFLKKGRFEKRRDTSQRPREELERTGKRRALLFVRSWQTKAWPGFSQRTCLFHLLQSKISKQSFDSQLARIGILKFHIET